jgi:hypothetical protein
LASSGVVVIEFSLFTLHHKRHQSMSGDEKKFDRIRLGFEEEDSKMEMEDFVCLEEVDLKKLLEVTTLMSDRGILRRIWNGGAQQQGIIYLTTSSLFPSRYFESTLHFSSHFSFLSAFEITLYLSSHFLYSSVAFRKIAQAGGGQGQGELWCHGVCAVLLGLIDLCLYCT